MGARVLETTVINRAPLDAPEAAKPLSVLGLYFAHGESVVVRAGTGVGPWWQSGR